MENPNPSFISKKYQHKKSPIMQLQDNPEADTWVNATLAEVETELKTSSMSCAAPETYRYAYWHSLKYLLEKLKTKNKIELWEVNRELEEKNPHFNAEGFINACEFLFQ